MCQVKSGLVLKDKVFMPLDYDSHEDMIKELKLKDTTQSPDFVRVEIIPKDGDLFNHNLDKGSKDKTTLRPRFRKRFKG